MALAHDHRPLVVYSSPVQGATDPAQPIELEFALRPRDSEQITTLLRDLKNPSSSSFGHFLTPGQFRARFGRTPSEIKQVVDYAQRHNLTVLEVKPNNLFVRVSGKVSDVNAAFGVTLKNYVSTDSRDFGRIYHAPDRQPTVDSDIAPLINSIVGLDNAALAHTDTQMKPVPPRAGAVAYRDAMQLRGLSTPAIGEQSFSYTGDNGLSPYDTDNLYGFYNNKLNGTTVAGTGQVLACAEEGTFTRGDISQWLTYYSYGSGVPLEIYSVDGYNTGSAPSGASASETTLDLDMLLTFAYKAAQIQVYEANPDVTSYAAAVQEFTDEFSDMANASTLPSVISVSYGFPEDQLSQSDVTAEGEALDQLALQGQTVCVSSGDTAAHGDESNSSPNVLDPGSQPTVVCVAGTDLQDEIEKNSQGINLAYYVSESAWYDASDMSRGKLGTGSGGGISKYWTLPFFQQGAFSTSGNPQGSTSMRNTPDVSMFGDFDDGNYSIYYTDAQTGQAGWGGANGTSAAAPLWAGLLACVNQFRAINDLPNIGEADPDIYTVTESSSYANDFHDIKDGSTNGYYKAVTGYDNATGWGTPSNAIQLISDLSESPVYIEWELEASGTTVTSGKTLTGAIALPLPASQNDTFALSSSNTADFTVPSTVTVEKGSSSAEFTITAKTVTKSTSATLTASYFGYAEAGTITVNPATAASLSSLSLSPTSLTGGSANSTGTVTLTAAAPSGGAAVSLKSSNTSDATVPSSVTVAAGATTATFTVTSKAVASSTSVTITASYSGVSKTASLTVTPASSGPALSSVYISPTSTTGGSSTTANRAYLSGNATADTTVTLTSSNTNVATVPPSVLIKTGSSSHTFTITTKAVASSQTVTITAKANGMTQTGTLTVTPAGPSLQSVTLSPTSTRGGTTTTASRVYLTGNATSDTSVTITSSNTAVAKITTTPVTIKTGLSSHVFTIQTSAVTSTKTVTITATANGISKAATLTVTP